MAALVAGLVTSPVAAHSSFAAGGAMVARRTGRVGVSVCARLKRPVEERYGIQHEKNVPAEKLKELGVERWSKWECGPNVTYRHEWQVDELVYISKGSVMVTPQDCEDDAYFYQGDLVRFPKWLVADLTFEEDYEQCYRFLAYAYEEDNHNIVALEGWEVQHKSRHVGMGCEESAFKVYVPGAGEQLWTVTSEFEQRRRDSEHWPGP